MQLKDYYTTLEVTPTATAAQVKKSFRQLALRHHPDKNAGSALAEAKFKEIQEAYEVLSNPEKREEYNYKRWYSRTLKKAFNHEPLSAESILAECIRLHNYMLSVNFFQVDYDGLSYHIRQLLSNQNIAILQQADDTNITRNVTEKILQSAAPLPFIFVEPIALLLIRVAGDDQLLVAEINIFISQQQQKERWQKYRVPAVMLVTIVICWVIYLISK